MATLSEAYQSIADINLWFKNQSKDPLMLADISTIIPLRWTYFRDNWEFIKPNLVDKISSYPDPDFLNQQINDFSGFIEYQRVGTSNINPFYDATILYRFISIFDNIQVDSINLSNEEYRILASEVARVQAFSKSDFVKARNNVVDYRDRVADTYGLSDTDYNKSHYRSSIPSQITATIVEVNYLLVLQNFIKTVDFILANL